MNINSNANQSNPQNAYSSSSYGGAINPALLAGFQGQNKPKYPNPSLNPSQLINGMALMPQQPNQISPAQLLHQQQQQQQLMMMNGMGIQNPSSMGINPAALSSASQSGSLHQQHPHPHLQQSHPHASSSTTPQQQQQQQQHQQQQQLSAALGLTPAQFSALSQQEKQQKMFLYQQHQRQTQAAQAQLMGMGMGMNNANMNMGMNMNPSSNMAMNPNMNVGMISLSGQSQQQQQQQPPFRDQFRDQQQSGMNMGSGMSMGNINISGQQQQQQSQTQTGAPFRDQSSMGMITGGGNMGLPQNPQPTNQHQQQQLMGMGMMGMGGGGAWNPNAQSQTQGRERDRDRGGGERDQSRDRDPSRDREQTRDRGDLNSSQNPPQLQNTATTTQAQQDLMQNMGMGMGMVARNTPQGGGGGGYYDRPASRAGGGMGNMMNLGLGLGAGQGVGVGPAQGINMNNMNMNMLGMGMGGMMGMNAGQTNTGQMNMPPPAGLPRSSGGGGTANMGVGVAGSAGGGVMRHGMRSPSRAMSGTPIQGMGEVGVNGFKAPGQGTNVNVNPYPQQQGQGQGQQGGFGAHQQQQQHSHQHQQQQQQQQHQQGQQQQHSQPPQPQQQQQQQPQQPQPQHQLQMLQQQPPLRTNAASPFPISISTSTSAPAQPTSTSSTVSGSPPIPSSPYRGAKRKVGVDASPRMSTMGLGGAMGPPSVPPRSLSAASSGHGSVSGGDSGTSVNGLGSSQAQGQQGQQQAQAQGQTGQRQRSPSGAGGAVNVNGNGMMQELQARPQPQQQRQPSVPRQGSVAPKQGSVPPDTSAGVSAPSASVPSAPAASTSTSAAPPVPPTSIPVPAPAPAPPAPHLPPLPPGVSLNPSVTRVKVVPLIDSVRHIPPLSAEEIENVKGWMEVDKAYEGVFRGMKERMIGEAKESLYGWGKGGWWEKGGGAGAGVVQVENPWGNRWREPRERFDVRYPRLRKERDGRGRRGTRREGLRLPRTLRYMDTDKPEQLVPIRLEFDVEHHKMRDTFVWNLNDPVVTPENFAQTVVEDYNLSANYHAVIVKSINDQLNDFKAHSGLYDGDGAELSSPILGIVGVGLKPGEDTLKQGTLDEENEKWWREWRKQLRVVERGGGRKAKGRKRRKVVREVDGAEGDVEDGMDVETEDDPSIVWEKEKPLPLEAIDVNEQMMHEDMRILIRLDIIVGSMKLDDQFEWDLDNEDASPEDFAEVYTQELGLNGEFRTAIAHSIREQVQTYQKSLFLVGHPSDGSAVQDEDLRSAFLPSLGSAARPADQVPSFTPLLNYLSDGEIERNEKERDKDMNRRRKRNTRGRRGITLPDREPIRTYRTPAIGFPELDAATLALAAAASAPMSRRAAAAAASVTIANMVASENGTAFMPQMPSTTMIPQPPPMMVKEKKTTKGHFKAPPLPQTVFRPRAQVAAPTTSTAADVSTLPPPLENDPPPAPPPMSSAPSGGASASDSKAVKVITAKRAKELEREAKEKEFADGQHANLIDGVWHCSNCGCPESIAIGRRKGPLGDKSQCGTCGKFWHRHRRPRPVEYNTDPDFHNGVKRDAEVAKTTAAAKKRGGAAALRAQSATVPPTPAETSGAQTPSRSNGDIEVSSRLSPGPSTGADDDRAISPVSTASSASEPPLAQRLKINGMNSHNTRNATPVPSTPRPATPAPHSAAKTEPASGRAAPTSASAGANPAGSAPTSPTRPWPPQWLTSAKENMKAKYPSDRFDIILRKVNATSVPEWRIKCLDCPGKLYTPGPGETLSNYEVHLKNRQHRQRVNDRLNGTDS